MLLLYDFPSIKLVSKQNSAIMLQIVYTCLIISFREHEALSQKKLDSENFNNNDGTIEQWCLVCFKQKSKQSYAGETIVCCLF